MRGLNQHSLNLPVLFNLLASFLSHHLYLVAARNIVHNPERNAIYSKVSEYHTKSHETYINVDYSVGVSTAARLEQRKLEGRTNEEFSPMRVYFETSQLEKQIAESAIPNAEAKGALLINTILPTVADRWSNALSVIPSTTLFFGASTACVLDFPVPNEWITDGISGVDVIIFVGAYEMLAGDVICGLNTSTLAFSSHCLVDQNDRPVVGFVNICLDSITVQNDGSTLDSDVRYLRHIVLHEMGHALGLNSGFYKYFRNSVTNERLVSRPFQWENYECVDGLKKSTYGAPAKNVLQYKKSQQTAYYEIVTPTVRQVARNQFACQSVTGARLENQPSNPDDCFGSHFDERFFFNDLMSAYYDSSSDYFSPMTLAFFEDSGHYRANYDTSKNSAFGLGAGCQFVDNECIVNDLVPDYGKGFFCENPSTYYSSDDYGASRWQCGASHNYRGHCDLFKFKYDVKFPHFEDEKLGPGSFQNANYCPMVQINQVGCDVEDAISLGKNEVFGPDSKCVDVSENGLDYAMCLKTTCNVITRTFDFYVGNDMYSCEEDFQELKIESLTIHCPRLTAICPDMFCPSMCSGKGVCDWSLSKPACKCFNKTDTTTNCNDSDPVAPDKIPDLSADSYTPPPSAIANSRPSAINSRSERTKTNLLCVHSLMIFALFFK